MRTLQAIFKCMLAILLLLAAVIDGRARLALGLMTPGPQGAVWVHRWCRRLAAALGVQCEVSGPLPDAGNGMLAIVSNHVSYLDVLLYSATRPFIMVSKTEVRAWPLIGWITAQAGTIYVQRADVKATLGAHRAQTHAEVNAKMAGAYRSGLPVIFFPEGTTSDGSGILPFRRGLYNSILADQVPLLVAALRYELAEPNSELSVAEHVAFTGDAEFGPHLFNFLKLRGVKLKLCFTARRVEGKDRFELARNSREMMIDLYDGLGREAWTTAAATQMPQEFVPGK